ncbi:hypothetical protein TSUD_375490 [Trifolium subterraneum]|uniref:Uncharacterized protein n=1 Tax=Trifolium subterraneum TaxID=3900 RepID=A0A2Z6PF19_TRISU|nr:hypothetical protein TSUD_375490 [Trifolium subterraneum]
MLVIACSGNQLGRLNDIAISSNGSLIATSGNNVILWDPRQGTTWEVPQSASQGAAFGLGKYCYAKPSWLHACSVYAVPIHKNIRQLDFYHNLKSPSHVDYMVEAVNQNNTYQDVLCSQMIMADITDLSYNVIVAGTERSSLVIVSQRKSKPEEEEK